MKLIYTCLFSITALTCFSQQLPLFTQYREYSGILNPAAVPNDYLWYEKKLSLGLSYRRQWITDKDGPSTQVLRGDYLEERRSVSPIFGACILSDKVGRMGMTGLYVRGAMVFSDNPLEYGFSAGLSLGIVRYAIDLRNIRLKDATELAVYDTKGKIFPDAGIGVFGYNTLSNGHLIYGGLSIPQAIGLDVRFRNEGQSLSTRRERHFYGIAGYKIPLRDEFSFIEGSVWVRFIPPLRPSLDFNVRCQLDRFLYVGTGLGTNGNAHLEAGFLLGEDRLFRIGIGADLPFTQMSTYYGSSLEMNVGYAIDR